jgi:hypothetical protein
MKITIKTPVMIQKLKYLLIILSSIGVISCEDPYTPSTQEGEQEIVVEGFVEAGPDANPTIVFVTKSIPFFEEISADKFTKLFVKDAVVSVNDGLSDVPLTQLCLEDLSPDLKKQAYLILGLNPDSATVNICVYVDLLNKINRRQGGKYDLTVKVDNKILTATTTIPKYVGLYDFVFKATPGVPIDSLSQMFCKINDPAETIEYYRYFTATQGDGMIAPFQSVTNDLFFNGKEFEFPLNRAQRRGEDDFDPNSFGMYKKGDTISVKWCTIDKAHFDFWNTRDFNANSGGPFSSYTRIISNIKGGLGIWGGYATDTYEMVVPK